MARIILATGGVRSGKSSYTRKIAEALPGRRAFVATCPAPAGDDLEMLDRVGHHQQERLGTAWETIEEEIDLHRVVAGYPEYTVLLIDCLTLWVSNLLRHTPEVTEDKVTALCHELTELCKKRQGTVIFVTNEVGSGVVPANAMARKFRDLTGRCNKAVAAGADEVVLVSCGLPLFLKTERYERE